MVDLDLNKASDSEISSDLEFLRMEKKKLLRQVDDLDTKIIGLKEELRRRKEQAEADASVTNQDIDDTSF
ncbi:MAG TPA: hypothetical protein VM577_21490 [Anaerovoracaceae bacterium]|nr:hypothetical protein [Anaerovoracaceae bacterium]